MGNKITKRLNRRKESIKKDVIRNFDKVFQGPPDTLYTVMGMFDYEKNSSYDISFKKGEIMYVIDDTNEWYDVEKDSCKTRGKVPNNYVKKQDGTPRSVEAWREVERWEAEMRLMKVGLQTGTYIIRPSAIEKSYAISVRDFDDSKKIAIVKNFRIQQVDNGSEVSYCVNRKNFPDMLTMIDYYKKNGIGPTHICLTNPLSDDYQPPIHFKDIEVNRDNIELNEIIGNGHFGVVYRAKWGRNYIVATKTFVTNKKVDSRSEFLAEAEIMHKLRHRKIVELLGVCTEPVGMPILILLEYMENGSLKNYLMKKRDECNMTLLVSFMKHISEGMSYLESQKIVHRDLRADNVLVSKDLTAKVSDFGLTNVIEEGASDSTGKKVKFPYKWTAPEAAESKIFNTKSDVWSFGVVVYEIVTKGGYPYPGEKPTEVIEKVKAGYRMPNPSIEDPSVECTDEIYSLMLKCWNGDPDSRPNFNEILKILDNEAVYT